MIARTDNVSLRHALLAVVVMAVWGSNFVVIHFGLEHLPPLMFAALRFAFALFPAVLFIRRPAVPWRNLAASGVLIGAGQFGILYIAMNGQITPALASLVVQMQVFFTMALAAYQDGERVRHFQWLALSICIVGLALIMLRTDASTTPLGLVLVLVAALCWAGGNMVIRRTPDANMLGYCSATLCGAGCCRAIRLPPSRRCRCSCRCSASPLRRSGWASRCRAGSCRRRRSCSLACSSI